MTHNAKRQNKFFNHFHNLAMNSLLIKAWGALLFALQLGFVIAVAIPFLFNQGWLGMLLAILLGAAELTAAALLTRFLTAKKGKVACKRSPS